MTGVHLEGLVLTPSNIFFLFDLFCAVLYDLLYQKAPENVGHVHQIIPLPSLF